MAGCSKKESVIRRVKELILNKGSSRKSIGDSEYKTES